MQIDDLKEGRTYANKGADSDKTRKLISIDRKRQEATTEIYRAGKLIGADIISLRSLAQWAAGEVANV